MTAEAKLYDFSDYDGSQRPGVTGYPDMPWSHVIHAPSPDSFRSPVNTPAQEASKKNVPIRSKK